MPEIFLFAAGAIAGFALVEAVVTGGFKHGLDDEPSEIKALGGSISVLSVGGALAGTLGIGMLTGTVAWPLGSFAAPSCTFVSLPWRSASPSGCGVECARGGKLETGRA